MTSESRQSLERCLSELSEEIRRYPTPIARCDEQLLDLLERRSQVFAELKGLEDRRPGGCTEEGIWINDGGFHAA